MKNLTTILSITGSDGTGGAGVQADIKTISALGAVATTAITSVIVQSRSCIHSVHSLPAEVVAGQVRAVVDDLHPRAIKVGIVADAAAMKPLRDAIVGCPRIVVDPGILSSHGTRLVDAAATAALVRHILPETLVLLLRCSEAELLIGTPILTDDDMLAVAQRLCALGPRWVLLRGGHLSEGHLTALLYGPGYQQFFTSYNVEGWQRHGVGGALSSAITTRLALGFDVPTAVHQAHDYIHSQIVYAVDASPAGQRPAELYNRLLDFIADHYREAHDVAFYADRLAITPRYLSQVTRTVVGKSPKQIIDEYLYHEAEMLLRTTSLSIQEVSDRLGFSSQVQFCRFVKKGRGLSPSELRRTTPAPTTLHPQTPKDGKK